MINNISIKNKISIMITIIIIYCSFYTANLKNMALLLEPGTHRVLLRYERPAGRFGLGISLAAWVLLLLLLLRDRARRRRRG